MLGMQEMLLKGWFDENGDIAPVTIKQEIQFELSRWLDRPDVFRPWPFRSMPLVI